MRRLGGIRLSGYAGGVSCGCYRYPDMVKKDTELSETLKTEPAWWGLRQPCGVKHYSSAAASRGGSSERAAHLLV